MVEMINNQFNCNIYYSLYKAKTAVFKGFAIIKYGVIIATNALGFKIDIPDIHIILYVGLPRTLTDYV